MTSILKFRVNVLPNESKSNPLEKSIEDCEKKLYSRTPRKRKQIIGTKVRTLEKTRKLDIFYFENPKFEEK